MNKENQRQVKVSIILPVYNGEKYLNRCIKTIISQTYKNIELIIINDGSTDNTKQICEEYSKVDSRVVVINKENEGVSKARNIGLEIARGKYVTFVDADDWIDIHTYENTIKIMEEKDIDILKFSYIREYGKIKKYYKYTIDANKVILKEEYDKKIYPYMFSTYDMSSVCLTIFRRENLNKIKFDLNLKYGEDFLFITQAIIKSNKIYVMPNFYYHYFCNNTSVTNIRTYEAYEKKISDIIYANNKLLQQLENAPEFIKLKNDRILKECNQVIKQISIDNNYRNFKNKLILLLEGTIIPMCYEIEKENFLKKYNYIYYKKIRILEKVKKILKNLR